MTAISIAMIVKNEAAHVSECVASALGLASEICVVDTGSTDGTLEMARQLGCRTGAFVWENDFAAARNASLALCVCPWIFILDADERITPEDARRIRSLTENGGERCYRFPTRNYTNDAALSDFTPCAAGDVLARGFAGWHPSWKVRLFPNIPGVKFVGAVHELVHESLLALGVQIETVTIPIHHYPLARPAERIAEKQRLYLELGLQKTRETPDSPKAHGELGAQYVEMKRYPEALQAYKRALRLAPENMEYLTELGSILHLMGHGAEARKSLEIAVRRAPESARAWRNLGVVHAGEGQWDAALRCFERAAALAPDSTDIARCLAAARRRGLPEQGA